MGVVSGVGVPRSVAAVLAVLPRHHLPRPELLARLDDEAQLTIVYGVQGYGKTTLLAEWVRGRAAAGRTTLWLTATPALNRPDALARALQAAWVDADSRAPADGDGDVALVIDDLQHLDDPGLLQGLIDLLQEHRGLRIVVASRRQHPIETHAAAEVEVRVVLSRELLFDADQIGALSRLMGRPVARSDAERIHAAIGGWVSAVRIVLELSRPDAPLPLAAVRDYFVAKVIPSVRDEYVLYELMRFSLADRLDLRAVEDLAGDVEPAVLLDALERPGLLERRYELDRVELHLPSLVRDLLRETFERTMPDAAQAAHRDFARWFERSGGEDDLMAAFEHAVRAQDPALAVHLWQRHGSLLTMSFPERLHAALTALPAEVVATEPGMGVTLDSHSVFAGGIGTGVDGTAAWFRAYATASFRALADGHEHLSLRDLLHFAPGLLIGLRSQGRFDDAVAFAGEASARIAERLQGGEDPGDRLSWFHLQAALTHRIVGDEVAAIPAYRLAWEHAARTGMRLVQANAAAGLALIHAYRSDHRRARSWLERQRGIATAGHWAHHLVATPASLALALMRLDALDPAGCQAELAHLEDGSAPLDAWQVIAYVNAQHALHFGDPEAALAALDEAEHAHHPPRPGERSAFVILTRSRADLLLMAGRGHEALALVDEHPENPLLLVPLARARLLAGDHAEARAVVTGALWQARRRARDRLELLLIDAVAALRMGDAEGVRTSARRMLPLARSSGNPRVLSTVRRSELEHILRIAQLELTADERELLANRGTVYPDAIDFVDLTERERVLLQELEAGRTRKEIAESLFVSINTVKSQLAALYEKLGASSREEAVLTSHRLGLL